MKLRIHFDFSLVLILFGQEKLFLLTCFTVLTTFQWTSQNIQVHNSTSMWNAIFLLSLFLIKIQNLYILIVIISLGCNCNQTFIGILKWNAKLFRCNHVDEMICYELPVVKYKNSNWEQFQSKESLDETLVLKILGELLGTTYSKNKIKTTPDINRFLFSLVGTNLQPFLETLISSLPQLNFLVAVYEKTKELLSLWL